jgi:hypothetical protein
LRFESRFVRDPRRRLLLARLSAETAGFGVRLADLYRSGDRARTHASPVEVLRKLGGWLRDSIGCRNDGDAIANCLVSRDRIASLYDDAISHASGPERSILLDHKSHLDTDRRDLLALQF